MSQFHNRPGRGQWGEMESFFRGEKLYGDDFSPSEIEAWFSDEEKGYYNLGAGMREQYVYGYHALNWIHGYSALPDRQFTRILGIGSAYGDELRPMVTHTSKITILEPSEGFHVERIDGVPVEYVRPNSTGQMPFPDGAFDLTTCLSVLHHIPNVSAVLKEIYRCAAPGGYVLLREPVVSMGDWQRPRKGLTRRERGIPLHILHEKLRAVGFEILRQRKFGFPITRRLGCLTRGPVFNSRVCTHLDSLICFLPIWPKAYHPKHPLEKLRPNGIFFVLRRPLSP